MVQLVQEPQEGLLVEVVEVMPLVVLKEILTIELIETQAVEVITVTDKEDQVHLVTEVAIEVLLEVQDQVLDLLDLDRVQGQALDHLQDEVGDNLCDKK